MSATCSCSTPEPPPENGRFEGISASYRRALWVVIAINFSMFVVEMAGGAASGSRALQADALDFLADSVTYAISLYVIGKSLKTRATAALFKGISLGVIAMWVMGAAIYRIFQPGLPEAETMGAIGVLALMANVFSALVLLKYRDGDANVRSVWLCSRNDAIGNAAVIVAAFLVWLSNSGWPDLAVAIAMAGLFLRSSWQIIGHSLAELKEAGGAPDKTDPDKTEERSS